MGRRSVLSSSEKRAIVVEVLRDGGSIAKAGRAVGCSRQSILRYMQAHPGFAYTCGYDANGAPRPPVDTVAGLPTAAEVKAMERRVDVVAAVVEPRVVAASTHVASAGVESDPEEPSSEPLPDVIDAEVVEASPPEPVEEPPARDLGNPTPNQLRAAEVLEAPVDIIQEIDASMPDMDDVVLPDGTPSLKLSVSNALMLAWVNAQDRTAHPSVQNKGLAIISRVTLQTTVERQHLRERARAAQIEEMRREAMRSESIEAESTQDNSGMVILEVPRNEARPHLHPEG